MAKKQVFDDDVNEQYRTSTYSGTSVQDGFLDRDGQFPLPSYRDQASTNKAVRGGKSNKLAIKQSLGDRPYRLMCLKCL